MTEQTFNKWFETFLEEKELPFEAFTLFAPDGTEHHLDTDVVVEAVQNCALDEKAGIKNVLVKIDFANGNVNHFFKHLAQGLVDNY